MRGFLGNAKRSGSAQLIQAAELPKATKGVWVIPDIINGFPNPSPFYSFKDDSLQKEIMQSLLKEQTSEKHRIAERKPFNLRMFKGELSGAEYLFYLEQQEAIFAALETTPLPYSGLNRLQAIQTDIEELVKKGYELKGVLPSTQAYSQYINELSLAEKQPHIYLHYLALIYGGQMMKSKVPSSGKMYEFNNMEECIQSIRRIQSDEWVNEVNKGYDHVIALFDELENTLFSKKTESYV